jgi:hypothetical protein
MKIRNNKWNNKPSNVKHLAEQYKLDVWPNMLKPLGVILKRMTVK